MLLTDCKEILCKCTKSQASLHGFCNVTDRAIVNSWVRNKYHQTTVMHQLAREVDPPQKAKDTWPNFQMSQQNDNDMLQL